MMLLTWIPVPGTTMPDPSPFVQVTEQARPAPSMTEMCVVEPMREPSEPRNELREALLGESLEELGRALVLRLLHRGDDRLQRRRPARRAVQPPEREREQDPAGRGRRVREDVAAAVAHAQRHALDRLVAAQVLLGQDPVVGGDPVDHRGGDVAGVERRGALVAEALDRVAQRRVAPDVADVQQRAGRRVDGLALGRRAQDPLEQVDDLGLLGVDGDAVARERGRRAPRGRPAAPSPSGASPRRSRPGCRTSRRRRPRRGRSASRRRRSRPRRARAARDPAGRGRSRARRRRSPAAPAPRRARPRACSRPRRARSAAARPPTTSASPRHAASTALPPARSTSAPACAVSGWPAATIPGER